MKLQYHNCTKWTKPHSPEVCLVVGSIREAQNRTPRGTVGYVDWSNARRRWIIHQDGTTHQSNAAQDRKP